MEFIGIALCLCGVALGSRLLWSLRENGHRMMIVPENVKRVVLYDHENEYVGTFHVPKKPDYVV